MVTINSLSGGKSSSYIALHYPADYNLFALVCVDDHNCGKSIDTSIKKMVNDKLFKYNYNQGFKDFVATTEDPKVLKAMFDLEQMMGEEIIWLRGVSWETMLKIKRAIPNLSKRFCTTIMKMIPVFEFCFKYTPLPVKMRIGYRYDEKERIKKFSDIFRMSTHGEMYDSEDEVVNPIIKKALTHHPLGLYYYVHRWKDIRWRVGDFPLVDDKITTPRVERFWDNQNIEWPEDSNCQNCFWKAPQQLRMNYDTNPDIMRWAAIQEAIFDHTFKDDLSLVEISRMGIQLDFFYGTGAGCSASGFCTS